MHYQVEQNDSVHWVPASSLNAPKCSTPMKKVEKHWHVQSTVHWVAMYIT